MQQIYENNELTAEEHKPNIIETASESLLANLPIIILGLAIFLTVIRELIA